MQLNYLALTIESLDSYQRSPRQHAALKYGAVTGLTSAFASGGVLCLLNVLGIVNTIGVALTAAAVTSFVGAALVTVWASRSVQVNELEDTVIDLLRNYPPIDDIEHAKLLESWQTPAPDRMARLQQFITEERSKLIL